MKKLIILSSVFLFSAGFVIFYPSHNLALALEEGAIGPGSVGSGTLGSGTGFFRLEVGISADVAGMDPGLRRNNTSFTNSSGWFWYGQDPMTVYLSWIGPQVYEGPDFRFGMRTTESNSGTGCGRGGNDNPVSQVSYTPWVGDIAIPAGQGLPVLSRSEPPATGVGDTPDCFDVVMETNAGRTVSLSSVYLANFGCAFFYSNCQVGLGATLATTTPATSTVPAAPKIDISERVANISYGESSHALLVSEIGGADLDWRVTPVPTGWMGEFDPSAGSLAANHSTSTTFQLHPEKASIGPNSQSFTFVCTSQNCSAATAALSTKPLAGGLIKKAHAQTSAAQIGYTVNYDVPRPTLEFCINGFNPCLQNITVSTGTSVTLNWRTTNANATNPVASNSFGAQNASHGSVTVTPAVIDSTYSLRIRGISDADASASNFVSASVNIHVNAGPFVPGAHTATIRATPNPCVTTLSGSCTTTLTWSSQNVTAASIMRTTYNGGDFNNISGPTLISNDLSSGGLSETIQGGNIYDYVFWDNSPGAPVPASISNVRVTANSYYSCNSSRQCVLNPSSGTYLNRGNCDNSCGQPANQPYIMIYPPFDSGPPFSTTGGNDVQFGAYYYPGVGESGVDAAMREGPCPGAPSPSNNACWDVTNRSVWTVESPANAPLINRNSGRFSAVRTSNDTSVSVKASYLSTATTAAVTVKGTTVIPPGGGVYMCNGGNYTCYSSPSPIPFVPYFTALSSCQTACQPPEQPSGYNCVNNTCSLSSAGVGQYPTLSGCQSACQPPGTRYVCNDDYTCSVNPLGEFGSAESCADACQPGTSYSCSDGCSGNTPGTGQFLTRNGCQSACTDHRPRYMCVGSGCVLSPDGPFTDSACNDSCSVVDPARYTCNLQGQCVLNFGGQYTTSNCNNECGSIVSRYACNSQGQCVSSSTGSFGESTCNNECPGIVFPPSCTMSSSPNRLVIPPPGTSRLNWSCRNVSSCSVSQGVGFVNPIGSASVSPSHTTTYTVTCSGPSGPASASASVAVRVFSLIGGTLKEILP